MPHLSFGTCCLSCLSTDAAVATMAQPNDGDNFVPPLVTLVRATEQQRRIAGWVADRYVASGPAGEPDSFEWLRIPDPNRLFQRTDFYVSLSETEEDEPGAEPEVFGRRAERRLRRARRTRLYVRWARLAARQYWAACVRQIVGSHWSLVGDTLRALQIPPITNEYVLYGRGQNRRRNAQSSTGTHGRGGRPLSGSSSSSRAGR